MLSGPSSYIATCNQRFVISLPPGRWTQQVLFPRWWWSMWGIRANDQHQRLWRLHSQRFPGSVGFQRLRLTSQWPAVSRMGGHRSASSNPGEKACVLSCSGEQSPARSNSHECSSMVSIGVWCFLCPLTCCFTKEGPWQQFPSFWAWSVVKSWNSVPIMRSICCVGATSSNYHHLKAWTGSLQLAQATVLWWWVLKANAE